jgi:hypothetical protein
VLSICFVSQFYRYTSSSTAASSPSSFPSLSSAAFYTLLLRSPSPRAPSPRSPLPCAALRGVLKKLEAQQQKT